MKAAFFPSPQQMPFPQPRKPRPDRPPFPHPEVFFLLLLTLFSCSRYATEPQTFFPYEATTENKATTTDMRSLARIFAALPIEKEQMIEVRDAAFSSSDGGYDEEYTMERLLNSPGCGVGETQTRAGKTYTRPLRDLLGEYLGTVSKAGGADAEEYLNSLSESDLQIYWPYSDSWDGEELPTVTFDPGYDSEYNYGYRLSKDEKGFHIVDSVRVDESIAMEHPVWVINSNNDAAYSPVALFLPDDNSTESRNGQTECGEERQGASSMGGIGNRTKSGHRMLYMKSFKMLRNYDSWFRGGSEFFIKCGSVNGFSASTEAELKLYQPSVTDFMVVIKRRYLKKDVQFNSVIMTDFTNQLENLAFLITEDDGGTRTSWKCSASVKIKSKSYGFDVDLPYNDKDDIVWRGQLSACFFQGEDVVRGRFGDVEVSFALE